MRYTNKTKEGYALDALDLAENNYISINAFCSKGDDFFISLGKLVYEKLNNGKLIDSISFGDKSNLIIGERNKCYISIAQS